MRTQPNIVTKSVIRGTGTKVIAIWRARIVVQSNTMAIAATVAGGTRIVDRIIVMVITEATAARSK